MELAFTLDLQDDAEAIAEYIAAHEAVWPEVNSAARAVGIKEERIWLLGRRLFLLIVAEDDFDWERDMGRYLELPRTREWDELMRKFQVPVPEARADDWWAPMEKVFDLNWPDDKSTD